MTSQPSARGGMQGGMRRWEPFRTLGFAMDPLRTMREMFNWDPYSSESEWWGAPSGGLSRMQAFAPDIEVKETKDSYLISADLPGMRENDVEVDVSGNRLTISGKREEERRDEGDRYWAFERSFGSFSRSFTLPEGVNPEQIEANLDKGVLCVRVPKMRAEEPKKIHVRGGGAEEQPAPSGTRVTTGGQTSQAGGASQTQAQGSQGAATTQGGSKEKAA